MRKLDCFQSETRPPFETIRVGEPRPDARPHGVVVLNDGPKRELSLSVADAGTSDRFDGSRLLDSGDVFRLSLQRPDRYEVTVAAPAALHRRNRTGVVCEDGKRHERPDPT
jgi:hypothetical protein